MTVEYEPFDQDVRLGPPPWKHTPELGEWERAHGHDVRLKCYTEFGCQVIEPTLERRIARLELERDEIRRGWQLQTAEWAEIRRELQEERDLARESAHVIAMQLARSRVELREAKALLQAFANEDWRGNKPAHISTSQRFIADHLTSGDGMATYQSTGSPEEER